MHIVVGSDGSDASKKAFELAATFFKPGDHITVVHVSDPAKDPLTLPFDYRAPSIEEYYRTRCPAMFPGVSWKFLIVLKSPGLDTKASLITWLNSPGVGADLLVVGMVGRKGPKAEPTLIGRTTDYALREAHVSSVICKLHEMPTESIFAVAVDGSERSHLGVELVAHLVRPCDRVVIVHAEDHAREVGAPPHRRSAAVATRYTELCAGKPGWSYDHIVKPADKSVSDVLREYALERGVHHLVIGVDGISAHAEGRPPALGSNTDSIAKLARCDVICVQQKGRLYLSTASVAALPDEERSFRSSRLEPADFEHKGD